MAHKLTKGLMSLFKSVSYSPRVRQSAPTTTEPYARKTLDDTERQLRRWSCCSSPFHVRRPGLDGIANVARSSRGSIDSVPATSSPRSCQWQGVQGSLHGLASFSSTADLAPRSFQWEGVRDLEENLRGNSVSGLAGSTLKHSRQKGQEVVQLPFIIPLTPTAPSPLADRPHQRRRSAGAMPRCGYDTTNMHVATNPRPAATAGSSSSSRSDKPRSDANNTGGGSGRNGDSDRGEGNGGHDDDGGSEKTPGQEPGRGSKDEEPNTEEHKTIDDVRLPLPGRGWTFWL